MIQLRLVTLAVILSACATGRSTEPPVLSDAWYPAPSGAHAVGVRELEMVDSTHATDRPQDARGRRLILRAWYPTSDESGPRRRYFEGVELAAYQDAVADALFGYLPAALLDTMATVVTRARVDAPVDAEPGSLPVVIYSHGGLSFLSQNTALMEELASHGYLVISVSHPGGASAVVFGDSVVRFDPAYQSAVMGLVVDTTSGRNSSDIAVRYRAALSLVDSGGLGPWAPRWRDDMIAVADLLEQSGGGDSEVDRLLASADLGRLAYAGMSYGASAATSAAQADPRARAAINFDGTHWLSDLLDTEARVPILELVTEPEGSLSNEFFFEKLATMGTNPGIVRVRLPQITHLELMDYMLLPKELRQTLPGGGTGDGRRVHEILAGMFRAFLGRYLLGEQTGYPEATLAEYPDAPKIDMTYVREWAARR